MASLRFNNTALVWPDVSFNKIHWIIYIQIYKNGSKLPSIIKKEWYKEPMPANLNARYSVLSWRDGGTPTNGKHETIIKNGKQGRNVFQQAILEVSQKYKKQKDKHNISKIPPMLLKIFDDYEPSYFEKMDEDFYCQRKYNGTRCMAVLNNGAVELYSRKLHKYNVPSVESALLPFMRPGIIIDGELYIHNTPLQIISGIVRGSELTEKNKLNYVIFDLYNTSKKDMLFSDRNELLEKMFNGAKKPIIIALTYKIGKSKPINDFLKAIDKKYKDFLNEGYEGMVIRRDLPYEPSYHEKHSNAVFKHKPVRTKEFKIVDFTEGRGKDRGKLIWICEANNIEFSVRPKMKDDERIELFKEFKSGGFNKVKGKKLTIEYDSLSIDGVPQQPRALVVRDYE